MFPKEEKPIDLSMEADTDIAAGHHIDSIRPYAESRPDHEKYQAWYVELMQRVIKGSLPINQSIYPDGDTPLQLSIRRGDYKMMKYLLNAGAHAEVHNAIGNTPLHLAVTLGDVTAVEILLQHGANIESRTHRGFNCLTLAVQFHSTQLVKLFVDRGFSVNQLVDDYILDRQLSLLHWTTDWNRVEMAEFLLQLKADVNRRDSRGNTCLHSACQAGYFDIARLLLRHGAGVHDKSSNGLTALYFAVETGHKDIVELLLHHGAEVNSGNVLGKTSLHTAIESCRRGIYDTLLRHGADVNAKDNLQRTPLHFAVKKGCDMTVELLLHHSADVNARDDANQTPLHVAVIFGHVKLLEPMLRHNVDVNALDFSGQSPLHLAVLNENANFIYCCYPYTFFAQLLENGAQVRTRTFTSHETPLHAAVMRRCSTFTKYLLAHGSDVDAIESIEGKTALQVAVENNDIDCVEQLLVYGADVSNVIFHQRISQPVLQTISRHFIRKFVAGMNVDPKYWKIVATDAEFARQCNDEVKSLKLTKLYNEQTYFEFLRGNRRRLVNFVENNEVRTIFEDSAQTIFSSDDSMLRRNFPIFADMLDKNYSDGVRYAPVLSASFERLINFFKLPAVPIERILDFLDDNDMRNILKAIPL